MSVNDIEANTYEAGATVTVNVTFASVPPDVSLRVRDPDDNLTTYDSGDVTQDSPTEFHMDFVALIPGEWDYLWTDGVGSAASEGAFLVNPNRTLSEAVTDLRDLRTLIPRARRVLDGPHATSEHAAASTMTDEEILGVIADAVANVILYTGAGFGVSLEVVSRDPFYMAPNAWRTSTAMTTQEESVVICEALIDYYVAGLQQTKVRETIKDEGQEWTYELSANLLRDQLKLLMDARDRALAAIADQSNLDEYVSFIAERDAVVATLIEPWGPAGGLRGGMELIDVRSGWLPG
jgi:hypothetical protein